MTAQSVWREVRGVRQGATLASRITPLSRNLTLFGKANEWVSKRRLITGLKDMIVTVRRISGGGGGSRVLSRTMDGASIMWLMLVMSHT